ncbi:LIM/homeobox protein Awh [Lepeophtheirus salmonis]|uniref:LIM/homeobox protein Awh n=1 Tax=Lepeophtheirus salmonis TaxID=72036 RepID=UPI001AE26B4E|nr:LIM/homeobox protein Awh-like [Lepeophtheirus salmonis]
MLIPSTKGSVLKSEVMCAEESRSLLMMDYLPIPHHPHPEADSPPSSWDLKGDEAPSELCSGCGVIINDQYILQVAGQSWHSTCLRCSVCQEILDSHSSCFIKDDVLFCKLDYARTFGSKCYKCSRNICPSDWVRKAREQIYHLACFSCDGCKRQLSTGEEFGIFDGRVLCKSHFLELRDGISSSSDESGESSENSSKKKSKRMRTTFTEDQIQILQANFQIDSNPDGQDLERIAQITGLSKRVTQVWFQNCRARQKKFSGPGNGKRGKSSSSSSSSSLSVPLSDCSPSHMGEESSTLCPSSQQLDIHVNMYPSYRSPSESDSMGKDSMGLMRGEV